MPYSEQEQANLDVIVNALQEASDDFAEFFKIVFTSDVAGRLPVMGLSREPIPALKMSTSTPRKRSSIALPSP